MTDPDVIAFDIAVLANLQTFIDMEASIFEVITTTHVDAGSQQFNNRKPYLVWQIRFRSPISMHTQVGWEMGLDIRPIGLILLS
jgi:hypothetical protein